MLGRWRRGEGSEVQAIVDSAAVRLIVPVEGYISVRRAASLCGLLIEDLEELFAAHGVEQAIEL